MIETKEYRTVDKSEWARGPWDDEADKMQWSDEATGLPCLIVRNPMGALCGYVGVPASHPYYEAEWYKPDVAVHGGLTFAAKCQPHDSEAEGICHVAPEGEDDVWWLGFDCSHSGDLNPKHERRFASGGYDTYRDVAYVTRQCADLAKQLAAYGSDRELGQ